MMDQDIRFGAVLFDDPEEHADGWACSWDTQDRVEVVRISGAHDLPSHTSWLTNLDYETWRATQIGGSRFRHDAFLSNRVSVILSELGLGDGQHQSARLAAKDVFGQASMQSARTALLAWVFDAVMKEAELFMPTGLPPVSDLASFYRDEILPPAHQFYHKQFPPTYAQQALEAADVAWTPAAFHGKDRPDGLLLRLPLDRVKMAQTLLDVVYPVGGWKLDTDMIRAINSRPAQDILNWLDKRPEALVKVTMRRTDPRFESLINWGANIQGNKSAGRWITASEAARLLGPCDLTIHAALTASHTMTSRDHLASRGLLADPAQWEARAGSYAFHLWVDLLWRGLCKAPQKSPAGLKSPAYTFMRAIDREACFYAALRLQEAGITVRGYGSGAVHVILDPDMPVEHWVGAALAAGLMPPLLAPDTLDFDWVATTLGLREGARPSARTLLYAALLLGEIQTVISLCEVCRPQPSEVRSS